MKNILQILLFFLLISTAIFSQDRIYRELMLENAGIKNLQESLKLNAEMLHGVNGKDSRVTVNKTQLSNGFLLMEEIHQEWDTTVWVNTGKFTYTYDINNSNLIQKLQEGWDGSKWVNGGKFTYSYNINNNKLIEELTEIWDGSNWVNFRKWTYTYDVNNNVFRMLLQNWSDPNWVNVFRLTCTYDVNNNLIEWVAENWYAPNWVNEFKENFYYDVNNYIIEWLRRNWFNSSWVNDARRFYFYDQNYLLVEELNMIWLNSSWENHLKDTHIYDLNNNRVETLDEWWNGSSWLNNHKYTFTYDINNNTLIQTLHQRWEDNNWENYNRTTHYYLPTGSEQVEHKSENLNKSIEDFQTTEDDLIIGSLNKVQNLSLIGVQVLIDSVLHTSDSDLEFTLSHNGISETIIYQAGGSGDNFIGTKLTDDGIDSISGGMAPFSGNYKPENPLSPFVGTDPTGTWTLSIYDGAAGNTGTLQAWGLVLIYNSSVGVENEITFIPEQFQLYQNYPNPFNPTTNIQFRISNFEFVKLKVYDVLGNEVSTLVNEELPSGEYEVEFNGIELTSGVYFYQLRVGEFIQTKKMLLLK